MGRSLISLRMYLTVIVMLIAAGLLFIQPQANSGAAPVAPQGKGGAVKPVPTPTPAPKKVTTKKGTTTSGRGNSKPNQNTQSKDDEAAATERTYWETIRNSTDPEDFRAYLKRYPNGVYADLATNRIKALEAAKPQPSPSPTSKPTPAATPETTYEWAKAERDLPARVRLDWKGKELSFSVPSGWTRTQREERGTGSGSNTISYQQLNFRSPESPRTNISIQIYQAYWPHSCRDGRIESFASEQDLIDRRRKQYESQNVSARLTDTEVVNHPTGRWQTVTADVHDMRALAGLAACVEGVYPDDLWQGESKYSPNLASLDALNRTRHVYAIISENLSIIVMLYTAPIEQFDEKMLPSVMATVKMFGGKISVYPASSDSSVNLSRYAPEIVIDGELKNLTGSSGSYSVSAGKHHVTVRANEHKTFEKDVFVNGWRDESLGVTLERIASGKSGTKQE